MIIKSIRLVLLFTMIAITVGSSNAQLKVHNNGLFILKTNSNVVVHQNVNIIGSVTFEGQGEMSLGGNWNNDGAFASGNGTVTFDGSALQNIAGAVSSDFNDLHIDKTGGNLELGVTTRVSRYMRMLSDAFFILNTYDLVLGLNALIFGDMSMTSNIEDMSGFNNSKLISNTAGTTGGYLVKEINSTGTFSFPVGTSSGAIGAYTPAEIDMSSATFGAGAYIKVRPVPEEHPYVENNNVSLIKYWNVISNAVTINSNSANAYFRCVMDEVPDASMSPDFHVLRFSPSLDPLGVWEIDPGTVSNVFVPHLTFGEIVSSMFNELDGDWTAGRRDAVQADYWSRQDGPYEDPNTWSRESHTGPPATSFPSKSLDRVHIGNNNTVSINTAPSFLNLLEVTRISPISPLEAPGTLRINGDYAIIGDTFRLEENCRIEIAHKDGIDASDPSGAAQTTIREYSPNATYLYFNTAEDQITGDGIPSPVKELIVGENASNTQLYLSRNLLINDILTINNGTFNLNDFSLSGNSADKTLEMTRDESELLITGQYFPEYFTPQIFTQGTITYGGSGNTTISSDDPVGNNNKEVLGYKNLKITNSGGDKAGIVTFSTLGSIKVYDTFDISELTFDLASGGWETIGSTFEFCGTVSQSVPTQPEAHGPDLYLPYGNLILGNGSDATTKSLLPAPSGNATVLNDLTINSATTFDLANTDIEVREDWINTNGFLVHNDQKVIFNPEESGNLSTANWTARLDNIFYDVEVKGEGTFQPLDEMTIDNDIDILESSTFDMDFDFSVAGNLHIGATAEQIFESNTLTLNGNWSNDGGIFTPNTSTVLFQNGSVGQTLSKASNLEEFYNLHIDNANHLDAHQAANGVKINITNGLNLIDGKLIMRDAADPNTGSWVQIVGDVQGESANRFVDGEMRKNLNPTNTATTYTYEIGNGNAYTPVNITFNTAGTNTPGTAGIVGIVSELMEDTNSDDLPARAIYTNGVDEILPAVSNLNYDLTIRRQWWIRKPAGSTFNLYDNQYNVTLDYIPYTNPGDMGDIRTGGDGDTWMAMDPRLWTGSSWIKPTPMGIYDGTPASGDRTTSSSSFENLSNFGHLAIGPADPMVFYSYVHGSSTGDWDDQESWSVFGYNIAYAPRYPTEDGNINDIVFIGGNDEGGPYDDEIFVNNTISNFTGTITIETDGKLSFEDQNYIGGPSPSQFYLTDAGILGVSHTNGITDAPTNDGNIRTNERFYNYNNHDNAHIVFRDSQNPQLSGNGVPNTIGTLTIEKTAGSGVTLNNALEIENYWHINSGDMTAGADITINGHLTRESGAGFDPSTNEVTFGGDFNNTVTDNDNLLRFHDLTISKPNSGNVILAEDSPIIAGFGNGQLTFAALNQGLLDARTFDDPTTRNYVRLENGGSISGAGKYTGWVNGELRMYIAAGNAPPVKFEVGTNLYYSPMELDFLSAVFSNGGTDDGDAGYLSGYPYPGFHPALLSIYNPPIGQDKAVPRYWRLGLPPSSTFSRGERNFVKTIYYNDPEDLGYLDTWQCTDMSFVTDWDFTPPGDFANWVTMYSISCGYNNNNNTGTNCNDTKDCNPTSNWYRYFGNTDNEIAFTRAGQNGAGVFGNYDGTNGVDHPFGSNVLDDGTLLFGDFVVGWQNSGQNTYYSFYSIVDDGNWTDPSTWSTVSFSSIVNDAVADTDHLGYPSKQYDNAAIGNNKRVILNESIGHGRYWGYEELYHYAGPVVEVQETGTLAFGVHVLRGNAFTAKSNSTIEIGTVSGINNENGHAPFDPDSVGRGNILSGDRAIEDNVHFIFTAEGVNSETDIDEPGTHYNYCWPGFFTGITGFWISNVVISTTPVPGTVLMSNNTGSDDRLAISYLHKSAKVTPNETYNITINVSNNSTNHFRVWIDFDRDGVWENNATELVVNNTITGTQGSFNFNVPSGLSPGVTQMRIQYRGNRNSGLNACSGGWVQISEVEDYTIVIDEPSTPPAFTQVNGNGLPTNLASIEVRTPRTTAPGLSIFELQKDINVRDYVQITAGTFTVDDADVDQIALQGDFINYVEDGFVPGTIEVLMNGAINQNIAGTETIDFYDLTMDKSAGSVFQQIDVNIQHELDFQEDNIFIIDDDITLTIEDSGNIITTGGDFSSTRMISVSGVEKTATTNTGTINKEFFTASGSQNFTYPLGTNGTFNPVDITVPASLTGSPSFAINLHRPNHPNFLSSGTNYLRRYWEVTTTDIDPISSLRFYYNQSDVFGNQAVYIPGYYYPANVDPGGNGQWEIDLGTNPNVVYTANPADDWYISLTNVRPLIGDVTVADPYAYFYGRYYYSKLLNAGSGVGNWNVQTNWSTEGHADTDYPSAYYPGELYENDVVFIDGGDQIDYNISDVTVESVIIGNTGSYYPNIAGTTGDGTLNFVTNGSNMLITSTTYSIDMANNGAILADASGGQAEIDIYGSILNESSGTGFDFYSDATNNVDLRFSGTTSVNIEGSGIWTDLATVIIDKSLSTDVVENQSPSLATGSQSFNNNYIWNLTKGVLRQNSTNDLSISGGTSAINMGVGTGIESLQGAVSTNNNLVTNNNTYLLLNGGNMLIGDAANEHLLYRSGTEVDLLNGSNLLVTGAFSKNSPSSTIDFSISTGSSVEVNNISGNTHSRIGFDISNTSSLFTMTGGEIIVATGSAAATSDYTVNAQNGGLMTGGTIQSGDGSTLTSNPIKFSGSMPIHDFHLVGDGSANTISRFAGNMRINNLWTIDENNTFRFNSNQAELHGDIYNAGTFEYANGTLLINNPTDDQKITNIIDDKLHFYNLTLNKTSGNLLLIDDPANPGATNLAVHNSLTFAAGNNAVIWAFVDGDVATDTNAYYVELSPVGGNTPSIIRSGQGHVFGRLYRHVKAGVSDDLQYHIGGPLVDDYRKTIFKSFGESGGTAGTVGIINYMKKHYRVEDGSTPLFVEYDTDFEEYWNVNDIDVNGSGTFTQGTNGTYELTTYIPKTFPSYSGDFTQYEHFIFTPQCPDLPDGTFCGSTVGAWDFTNMGNRGTSGSDIFLKSVSHDYFGDYVAAIPDGMDFYSIVDGDWNVSTNWSYDGYKQAAVSDGKYPGSDGRRADNIYIGDEKKITIPSNFSNDFSERFYRLVRVENAEDGPGELYIEGSLDECIFVNEFVLEDECLLGLQNIAGIRIFSDQGAAIRMRSNVDPSFGISRYLFYGEANQGTSPSIPDSVAAIIVDNSAAVSNNVSLSILPGITDIGIRDSVLINRGKLTANGRDFFLGGDFYLENNGVFDPSGRAVKVYLDKNHTFRLDNAVGLQLYNLVLDFDGIAAGNNLNIIRNDDAVNGTSDNLAHLFVRNNLTFEEAVIMDGREDMRKVILQNGATLTQNAQGWVDGYLGKYFNSGDNQAGRKFEIGYEDASDEDYDPVTLSFTSTASGIVEAIVNKDYPDENLNNQNYGHRMDPAHRVPRWWNIQGYENNLNDLGASDVNVLFEFPAAFISTLNDDIPDGIPDKAVIRRMAIPAEIPLWSERGPSANIAWDVSGDPVNVIINVGGTVTTWDGLGDFYIGDKFLRTFYSLISDDWENNLSWTFDPTHIGTAVPEFAYPGSDPLELEDMVEIGQSIGGGGRIDDIGNMLQNYTTGQVTIQGNSSLDMHNGTDGFSLTSSNNADFNFLENGRLYIGGDEDLSTSLFGFGTFTIGVETTVFFDGAGLSNTQTIDQMPPGLTVLIGLGNVTLNGLGTKTVMNEMLIRGNLTNEANSILDVSNCPTGYLKVWKNVVNSGAISNESVIEIGQ